MHCHTVLVGSGDHPHPQPSSRVGKGRRAAGAAGLGKNLLTTAQP